MNPIPFLPLSFSFGPDQGARIGVDAEDSGASMCPVQARSEVACTATDFEDGHPVCDGGLTDEGVVDPWHAQQAGEQVVERKERVPACGRQVVVSVPIVVLRSIWMIFGHISMVKHLRFKQVG